ncbi:PKD domain-containing protein [Kitasatospora sp. NPDC086009]|uniref:PKD domain-containing protein n=1 Tax=unclassified Kitasatospora TaxID=2633591 RepID=UPI0037CC4464
MRRARIPAAVVLVLSITGAITSVATASADATDLYVDNKSASCSDSAPAAGGQGTPFCTIAAATDVVRPGQTVHIAGGDYNEPIALTRSGTPTAPISFVGTPYTEDPAGRGTVLGEYGGLSSVVALTGVHDVVVRHLFGRSGREAVLVTDSSRVTIDDLVVYSSGWDSTVDTGYPSARITGASSDVTLSRNDISASHAGGVQVDAGVRHAVLTTNYLSSNSGVGVRITDAPDAVVTGNTVQASCGPLVELAGASTGATVENNVLDGDENGHPSWGGCASTGHEDLSVSVGSTAGTTADYNLVTTLTRTPYSWAGRTYATVAQFQQASGQGAHDLSASREDLLRPDSPAVDSADATAPGTLTTDGRGRPRADNPVVANTGTGVGYYDRGAVEAQDPLAVSLSVSSTPPAGQPLTAVINGRVDSPWSPATATLDFGDGSAPVGPVTFPARHDYAPGTYTATLTATDGLGLTKTTSTRVTVAAPGPVRPALALSPYDTGGQEVLADGTATVSPWPVATRSFDFGDGTAPVAGSATTARHYYAKPGTYTVTHTVTDDHGRSASITYPVSVATPIAGRWTTGQPARVAFYRNGALTPLTTNAPTGQGERIYLGQAGDTPVAGDWDGTGHDQAGVYRPGSSTFGLRHQDGSVTAVPMGDPGDVPVPGRWDGNGHAQLAVYRPSTGAFIVRHDDGSFSSAVFGDAGDLPVVGDWDGVGHTQLGIYRPAEGLKGLGVFALRHDDGSVSTAGFGAPGDLPIVGDWSGTGRTTYGVYRPSEARFLLSRAYTGQSDIDFVHPNV